MPRRTIALSSTSRMRIIAMCIPGRSGSAAYRRRGGRRLLRCAARRAGAGAGRGRLGGHPHRQHAALARRGLDAQVPARQQRALAHAGDAEVAAAGELLELVGHVEARRRRRRSSAPRGRRAAAAAP